MKGAQVLAVTVLLSQVIGIHSVSFEEDTTLTKNQARLFQKFKSQVLGKLDQPWMKDDLFLLRFLRAKHFDVSRAQQFLASHLNWRKDNSMNSIHEEDWSDMEKDYHYDLTGRDKEGRVLLVWDLGDWDVRQAVVAGKMSRLVRYTFKMWDEARMKVSELASQGQNVTRFTMILNMENINAVQHVNPTGIPYYLTASSAYDPHFPNMGDNIYLVNTPGLFETVLSLVRPVLGESTRNALKVYGKDSKVWKPIVDQHIDPSQLPTKYGGTLPDTH